MIGLVEQVVTLYRRGPERPGIGQQMRLANQLVVLAVARVGRGQLVALELEKGPLAPAGLARLDEGQALAP